MLYYEWMIARSNSHTMNSDIVVFYRRPCVLLFLRYLLVISNLEIEYTAKLLEYSVGALQKPQTYMCNAWLRKCINLGKNLQV